MTDFGARLRIELARKGWGQKELAEKLGVREQTVGAWMKGTVPEAANIMLLAEELGVDPGYLAFGHMRHNAAASALELIQQVLRQLETDPDALQRLVDHWETVIRETEPDDPAREG